VKKHTFTIETDFAIGDRVNLIQFGLYGTIVAIVLDGTQEKYLVRGHGVENCAYFAAELELIK